MMGGSVNFPGLSCLRPQAYYRWKKQFGDFGTAEVRELRQLREKNQKLRTLVADLTLDKTILREAQQPGHAATVQCQAASISTLYRSPAASNSAWIARRTNTDSG